MKLIKPRQEEKHPLTCGHIDCEEVIFPDSSHQFGFGISHYTKSPDGEYVRSYAQVFHTLRCCSRPHALEAIKSRIDAHADIPFGEYKPQVHNPSGEQPHTVARQNVEYTTDGILPENALPANCAVCGADLVGKDSYLPHVDDSTKGRAYQTYLVDHDYPLLHLGACSLEHAQALGKIILDEIIEPASRGEKPVIEFVDSLEEEGKEKK